MDNKRQVDSASSFTSELFGNKESNTSEVLASISPPYKGAGAIWQHQGNSREDAMDKNRGSYGNIANRESSEPCYVSSSLYYGGQETYFPSQSSRNSGSYYTVKKDGGEDDPSGPSRGNWWQGSLYY